MIHRSKLLYNNKNKDMQNIIYIKEICCKILINLSNLYKSDYKKNKIIPRNVWKNKKKAY